MAALKADDRKQFDVAIGDVLTEFRGYDLDALSVPHCARPRSNQTYMGKHGYTLRSPSGAVT